MDLSLWNVLVFIVAIVGCVRADETDASKRSSTKVNREEPLEERIRVLEGELQRVKDHLSGVENLLDAWFLSAEQPQRPSMIVNQADARWSNMDGGIGGEQEKRAGSGGWAFMGSRGKRKQPFIIGSRGKRSIESMANDDDDDLLTNEKRGAYFYGSRGKKQFVSGNLDNMPPFTNKRYTFMGSRGKK